MWGSHVDEAKYGYPKDNSSPISPEPEALCDPKFEEEEIVQEMEERLPFEISMCLYPEGEVLHNC